MEADVPGLSRKVADLTARHSYAAQRVEEEEKALARCERELHHADEAQKVVQLVAQQVQESAHRQISSVVTRCIQAVFPDRGYTFKIRFDRKRGKTEAVLVLERDGLELADPVNESGGGVVDVAAFALRLACLMLARPKRRLFLCLDEPLKNVNGEDYQERVAGLLLALSEEFGVQMLIVSDDDWLQIGKVIEV